MTKKILILNWRCPQNPLSGGAEKVTLKHAKTWAKNGMDVTWIAGNFPGAKKNENMGGIHIYRYGNPLLIYFYAPFLYWLKWKGEFDLVFDEIHGIPFLSPLWAWKSKKLAYIHEVAQEIWDAMFPFPINMLGKLYEKAYFFFYKRTLFMTGSDSTKTDLVRYGIPDNNISIIPHGLFLKPLIGLPKKEKELTLLYVSRLVKMKGIEEAMKIFAQVIKKNKAARFWIVGTGEDRYLDELNRLAKQLGIDNSITFHGYVSEQKKREIYQKAHFLLHTSIREGFGLVVIEANSQGTPVLAYDSPGLKDIVRNNINGFCFRRGAYVAIADKCGELYNSPKYRLLTKTAMQESKKYDWKMITKQSLIMIRKI